MATTDKEIAKRFLDESVRQSSQPELAEAISEVNVHCREAQNALRAAIQSSKEAIYTGSVINRMLKLSTGKALSGNWSSPAQDCLRSAVLFAGAGLDRALKRLVEEAIPALVDSEQVVEDKFQQFAEKTIMDSSTATVSPKELVKLLLGRGDSPRDVVLGRWMIDLTSGSAQSVPRVDEIASALGVTNSELRARIKPESAKSKDLKAAFDARNEIAHELDVTKPEEEVRKRLESIRKVRTVASVEEHVFVLLSVGQELVNDVARRMAAAAA